MTEILEKWLFIALIALAVFSIAVAIGFVVYGIQTDQIPQVTSTRLTESEPMGLGRQLIFPEGWTPILFSATAFDKGGFVFICEHERIYRYCTPVVIEAGND